MSNSNVLTEEHCVFILRQGLLGCLNEEAKKQVMDFAFNGEFMELEDIVFYRDILSEKEL
tara:strand:+ start:853 stop:1032 length:180 start_codon:yes stop_codon:yes gene_type:complete